MQRGYITLWRCIRDNHFWKDKPFDRARAWIDLIMMANHTDGFIRSRGISLEVKRGQVGTSEVVMSENWGWSRGKVRRFLSDLIKKGQIEQQNNNVSSLITIINYDIYQKDGTANGTADSTADEHQTNTKQYPKNNVNNEKNKNLSASGDAAQENEPYFFLTKKKRKLSGKRLDTFLKFWEAFGDKRSKAEAADAWLDIPMMTDRLVELIVSAASQYAIARPAMISAGQTPKMAQGWISGRRWEDEIPANAASDSPAEETTPDIFKEAIRRQELEDKSRSVTASNYSQPAAMA